MELRCGTLSHAVFSLSANVTTITADVVYCTVLFSQKTNGAKIEAAMLCTLYLSQWNKFGTSFIFKAFRLAGLYHSK
jgi:hypothetical protein